MSQSCLRFIVHDCSRTSVREGDRERSPLSGSGESRPSPFAGAGDADMGASFSSPAAAGDAPAGSAERLLLRSARGGGVRERERERHAAAAGRGLRERDGLRLASRRGVRLRLREGLRAGVRRGLQTHANTSAKMHPTRCCSCSCASVQEA